MPRQADFHELLAVIFCEGTGVGWRARPTIELSANQRGAKENLLKPQNDLTLAPLILMTKYFQLKYRNIIEKLTAK